MEGYTVGCLLLDIAGGKTVQDLLDGFPDPRDKGRLLDGLARCVVALRADPAFHQSSYLVGNSNKCLTVLRNVKEEFLHMRVNNSCGNGTSDVSFAIGKTLYMSSSKLLNDVGTMDDYDIDGLVHVYHENYEKFYPMLKIVLFVKDKAEFRRMMTRAKKGFLYTNKIAYVFGLQEIEQMVSNMRDLFVRMGIDTKSGMEKLLCSMMNIHRAPLSLLPHQEQCLSKTFGIQDAHRAPMPILWAMLPRSGKSYMVAGHILESIRRGKTSFLILTPVPSETIPQFKKDLFDTLVEFSQVDVVVGTCQPTRTQERPLVVLMSKQLDDVANRIRGKGAAHGHAFDVIYYDENHSGGGTDMSREMITSYAHSNTQIILMTATYHKPRETWHIPEADIVRWDLDDLDAARQGEFQHIYARQPKMCLWSAFHNPEDVAEFRAAHGERISDRGADMDRIFELNRDLQLSQPTAVNSLLDIILGGKETQSVMDRIREHANENGGRGMRDGLSQLWFLPYGQGRWIDIVSKQTKLLLEKHPIGREYHVACFNECSGGQSLRDFVAHQEALASASGKRGCIFLSGQKGSMGISLKKVDIVILLTHASSADDVYQKIFRCMTPDEDKRFGYVVDLDARRVLNTLLMYEGSCRREIHHLDMHSRILRLSRIVELRSLMDMEIPTESIVNQLVDIWRKDIGTRTRYIDRMMKNLHITIDKQDAMALRQLIGGRIGKSSTVMNEKLAINDASRKLPESTYRKVELDSESDPESKPDSEPDSDSESKSDSEAELEEDISDVIPTLVYLSAMITYNRSDWVTMPETLRGIYHDPQLCSIFEEQTRIYWNIQDMPKFKARVVCTMEKLIDTDIKELMECIRETMSQSLEDKKGLLEYLQSLLKPKEVEKKKYGEVFTPLPLVEEMLDKLPVDVWLDPGLKWFDPAVGIGNFMVCVYYRLMDSLEGIMPDEADRSRHILTEMLYMSEINQKNVHICRAIFGEDANIHQGDTLQLDIAGKWGLVDGFDVIVGNPPYNDGSGGKGKGHALWIKFVERTLSVWLKEEGYACMVHPALWRQVDHPMYRLLSANQISYLEIHSDADGMKMFRCSTRYDWYVLQKIPYANPTIILDEKGVLHEIDLRLWQFLPNYMYEEIYRMLAQNESPCDILQSFSAYETRKKWISKTNTKENVYPVVYTIRKGGDITLLWSSCNDRGHYGIPKVIIRSATPIIETLKDPRGTYGMTQWTMGIVSDPNDHDAIDRCIRSPRFQQIIGAISFRNEVSVAALRLFKARFWEMVCPS